MKATTEPYPITLVTAYFELKSTDRGPCDYDAWMKNFVPFIL